MKGQSFRFSNSFHARNSQIFVFNCFATLLPELFSSSSDFCSCLLFIVIERRIHVDIWNFWSICVVWNCLHGYSLSIWELFKRGSKILHFWNPKIRYRVHKSPLWGPVPQLLQFTSSRPVALRCFKIFHHLCPGLSTDTLWKDSHINNKIAERCIRIFQTISLLFCIPYYRSWYSIISGSNLLFQS
jgi:hypothetical protein